MLPCLFNNRAKVAKDLRRGAGYLKLKTFLLLAGISSLFLLPQGTWATQTNESLVKQQEKISTLEKQLIEIQKEQTNTQNEEMQLTASMATLEAQVAQLEADKEKVTKKIDSKKALIEAMTENLANHQLDVSGNSFKTALLVQTKQLKQLTAEFDQLEGDRQERLQEQATLLTEKTEQSQALANFTQEKTATEALLATEKTTLTQLEQAEQKAQEQLTALARTGFLAPLATSLNVSSSFGLRTDPTGYSGNQHDGIDLTGSAGTPILAARYGTVVEAAYQASAGNYVIIKHDNGYYTYYMHLTDSFVSVGQTVETSAKIGTMGTTGNSTGVHLHFGIATAVWSGFVDPANFIL